MLTFTDTLTGDKKQFVPRDGGRATIYWCGPTVYDHPHLGHARSALGYDILHRYLEWRGYDVTLVSNVTDIDDKIIQRAAREERSETDVAAEYERSYIEQMARLGIAAPDVRPRATEYVKQMVAVIEVLVDRGYAYVIEGNGVYFDVDRLADYGALVHRAVDDLRDSAGRRVDVDEKKSDPLDFALWKAAKPGEPSWPSPWGPGRPGWHIECVAMSLELLGPGFDIHGGGDDLVFPHHENERAEASGTGQQFARYWVHNGMVQVNNEKMSKSLGNFTTLADALDRYDARALRLLVLQTHYRKTMEINGSALDKAAAAIDRFDALARRATGVGIALDDPRRVDTLIDEFRAAMDDDLGTPAAVAVVFEIVRLANIAIDRGDHAEAAALVGTLVELSRVLGLEPRAGDGTNPEIDGLVLARQRAREQRDFAEADRIRDELAAAGIVVEDTATGPIWHRR